MEERIPTGGKIKTIVSKNSMEKYDEPELQISETAEFFEKVSKNSRNSMKNIKELTINTPNPEYTEKFRKLYEESRKLNKEKYKFVAKSPGLKEYLKHLKHQMI